MAIPTTCSACGKITRIKDEMAGKKFKCGDCGAVVAVPVSGKSKASAKAADDEDEYTLPKSSRRGRFDDEADDDDDDVARDRRSGSGRSRSRRSNVVWLAVGGGLVVLCLACVCVIPFYYLFSPRVAPSPQVAAQPERIPQVPGRTSQPDPQGFGQPPQQAFPEFAQNNAAQPPTLPIPMPEMPRPPAIPVPPAPKEIEKPVLDNEPARDWAVKVDPPAATKWVDDKVKVQVRVPGTQLGGAIFAPGPSPFVCVGSSFTERDFREVWDLSTMKKLGTIRGISADRDHAALSPDGKYYAAYAPLKQVVILWDVAKSKPLGQMKTPHGFFHWLEFAGTDKLLVTVGQETFVTKLPTGALDRTFEREIRDQGNVQGVSLGGSYLVDFESEHGDQRLKFTDLATGKSAGALPVPSTGLGFMHCHGIGFSPDGQELAVLFKLVLDADVLIWDVATGELKERIPLPDFTRQLEQATFFKGQKMQWFPDKQRILVHGYGIVDRREAKLVHTFSADSDYPAELPRKVLSDTKIGIVHGPFAKPMTLVTAKVGE